MILCLDIHTHHVPPQPEGIISVSVDDFCPIEGQLYSIGIHPWDTEKNIPAEVWVKLEKIASLPQVVAIGECGIDKLKGGPMFRQLIVLQKHIDLSEKIGKPLILHDVKAHDIIVGVKKDSQPKQNWAVHGFRGKPTVAKMLTDVGIYLSFGEKFNPQTPVTVPLDKILVETDESPLSIYEIIANLSANMNQEMTGIIGDNSQRFLGLGEEICLI